MLRRVVDKIALMMEAVSISETSVSIYQTTRRDISEVSHLQKSNAGKKRVVE
jgi:hypothetical protein